MPQHKVWNYKQLLLLLLLMTQKPGQSEKRLDKIMGFEMYCYYCYRILPGISRLQKIPNTEIRKKLNIGEDLLQKLMKRKPTLYAVLPDNQIIIKNLLLGTLEGTEMKGRPNNITG